MPRQVARVRAVTERVRELGSVVEYSPGWERRGAVTFDPRGHTLHHTGTAGDCQDVLVRGHGRLPGPLCNWTIERDGALVVIAAGRANHAGRGGYAGLTGNVTVWGTEIVGPPFTAAQLATLDRLNQALVELDGIPVELVHSHENWTPRKVDPAGPPHGAAGRSWDMAAYRRHLERPLHPPTAAQEDDDMALTLIPSWAQRDPKTSRAPMYRLAKDGEGHPLVLALNGAPLKDRPLPGSKLQHYAGIPFVNLPGLAAKALGIHEIAATGAVVVVLEDGGQIDVAARPRAA